MLLLSEAKTAVRSTRLPSLIVVSVTPGPVLIPLEFWLFEVALLQPLTVKHRAVSVMAVAISVRFMGRLLWFRQKLGEASGQEQQDRDDCGAVKQPGCLGRADTGLAGLGQ